MRTARRPQLRSAAALRIAAAVAVSATALAVAVPAAALADSPPASPGTPTQLPASEALSDFVTLFAEHVYAQGAVIATTSAGGAASPLADAARANRGTIDTQLAVLVGLASPATQAPFYREFEAASSAEVSAAVAAGNGLDDQTLASLSAKATQADRALGALVGKAFGVKAAAVTKLHEQLSDSVILAGVSTAAGTSDAPLLTEVAAASSATQASAYAALVAGKLHLGTITTRAAVIRASVTLLLVSHVQQTGLYTQAILSHGVTSPQAKAAGRAEDINTQAIAALFKSAFGASVGKQFLDGWRAHVGGYATYAQALRAGDAAGAARALHGLAGYPGAAAAQLATLLPNLGLTRLTQDLTTHINGTITEIDQQAGAGVTQFATALAGDKHFSDVAGYLAAALVAEKNVKGTISLAPRLS